MSYPLFRSGEAIPVCYVLIAGDLGGAVIKRTLDILVAALLFAMVLPVLTVAALIICFTSPGPILFRQTRMGRGFKRFEIVKLRTMAHAQAGSPYTLGPDARITRFGYFLRRSKIDELPQLWNVLRGEMSLVGPRPVLPALTEEFREYYELLLRARPGLTDPASLKYSQESRLLEQARDPMHFFKRVVTPDKIRISFDYMQRANLWSDCATLAMTVLICCFPRLSRVYGELPAVPGSKPIRPAQVRLRAVEAMAASDGSVFDPVLAMREADMEEEPRFRISPWIPLQTPVSMPQSAPIGVQRSASRL